MPMQQKSACGYGPLESDFRTPSLNLDHYVSGKDSYYSVISFSVPSLFDIEEKKHLNIYGGKNVLMKTPL